jgi:hypothetical protein
MRFPTALARAGALAAVLSLVAPAVCGAQENPPAPPPVPDGADLARRLSNPVSNLVSIPFQLNWDQGVGPDDQTRFVMNVQPVMPFSINKDWNLIARVIMPFVSQPALAPGGTAAFGVSDVLVSAFLSPTKARVIWGVGPALSLPSTTELTLGSGKWSAGPTVVVLNQVGQWTYGALWNQIWSFSGDPARSDVSQMFLQPFFSYTTSNLVTVGVTAEATANWKAPDDKWTVPVTFSVSKLASLGPFPASYQIGVGAFVAKPEIGPSWRLRTSLTILLPRR